MLTDLITTFQFKVEKQYNSPIHNTLSYNAEKKVNSGSYSLHGKEHLNGLFQNTPHFKHSLSSLNEPRHGTISNEHILISVWYSYKDHTLEVMLGKHYHLRYLTFNRTIAMQSRGCLAWPQALGLYNAYSLGKHGRNPENFS